MKTAYSIIRNILISLPLLLILAACGSSDTTVASGSGTGSIAANLQWSAGKTVAKTVALAPAGVTTVRLIVSGSGMTTIQQDYAAAADSGTISGVPAGSGRTVTAQGINAAGTVTHQGSSGLITVQAGQTANGGTIIMLPLSPPVAPTGLKATTVSATQINLSWNDTLNETGYRLERGILSGTVKIWSQYGKDLPANVTSTSDNDLTAPTYYYRLRAFNDAGVSTYSNEVSATPVSIVGTWLLPAIQDPSANSPTALGVITFLDNGQYIIAATDTPDASGQSGMERGTYTFNPSTGLLTATITADTNGEWGMGNGIGPVIPEVWTLTGTTITTESGSILTRLQPSASNPLVGSWGGLTGADLIVVSFLADSTFIFADGTTPLDTPDGQPGVERGTYSWNQSTGVLTVNIAVDTNGESGFSHPQGALFITVSGASLNIRDNVDNIIAPRLP